MHSVGDIALNPSLRKSKHEQSKHLLWYYGISKAEQYENIILEWTTSLDTSSRTLFVCVSVCPRHVERRVA